MRGQRWGRSCIWEKRHFASRLSRFEGSWKYVIVATVLTFVCLAGIYRYGVPIMANVAANNTPVGVVEAIDSGTLETVDRLIFSESKLEDARKGELTDLFEEVSIASGHREPPLKLLFRDGGGVGANALALPGGTIILTDQLEDLIESDDEIAVCLPMKSGTSASVIPCARFIGFSA